MAWLTTPVTSFQLEACPGFVEWAMFPPAPTATQSDFEGQAMPAVRSEGSTCCPTDHAAEPPVGEMEDTTLPESSPTTHSLAFGQAMAFEADPQNFAQLERRIAADERLRGRTRAVSAAVGLERGRLRFAASGMASAGLSEEGNIEVDCVPLDEFLDRETPTYIKMDIEGAEMDALAGAATVIAKSAPLLAICAYHTQSHLWEIPIRIRELLPEYRLFLRMHCVDGFDLVCYAIPAWRQ